MHPGVVWFPVRIRFVALTVWLSVVPQSAHADGQAAARDFGDILLKKGIITSDELQQAREEEKQKQAADESRLDALRAKLPKWLDTISLFGDMRHRVEGFYGHDYHAQTRYRLRARVGLNANVTDEISGTVRLASGDPNDPISTNQTLTNIFTRKPINLDPNPNFNSSLANSNDVVKNGSQIIGYTSGFNVINFGSELDFPNPFGSGIPAGLFGEVAHHTQASSRNTGLAVGVGIGKAQRDWYHDSLKNPGDARTMEVRT